jgi:hypothetical protein
MVTSEVYMCKIDASIKTSLQGTCRYIEKLDQNVCSHLIFERKKTIIIKRTHYGHIRLYFLKTSPLWNTRAYTAVD